MGTSTGKRKNGFNKSTRCDNRDDKKVETIRESIVIDYTIKDSAWGSVVIDKSNEGHPIAVAEVLKQHQNEEIEIQKVSFTKEDANGKNTRDKSNQINLY